MRCQDIREQLSAYIDGMLDSSLEARVKLHIASCEDCRLEYEDLMTAVELLKSLPEIAPPPDFNLKLQAKLSNLNPRVEVPGKIGLLGRLVRGKWSGPLAAAAVICLTVGVTALWYDQQHGDMFNPVVQNQIVDDSGRTRHSDDAKTGSGSHNQAVESDNLSNNSKKKTEAVDSNPHERVAVPKVTQGQQQQIYAGAPTGQIKQQDEKSTGAADLQSFGSADIQVGSKSGIAAEQTQPPVGVMRQKDASAVDDRPAVPGIKAAPDIKNTPELKDTSDLTEAPNFSMMKASPMKEADVPHMAREYRATWEPGDDATAFISDMAVKYDGIIEYEPHEAGQHWVLWLPGANVTAFLGELSKSGSLEVKTEDRDLTGKYQQIENKINELKEREQWLLQNNNTKELATLEQQIQQQSQALAEINKETSMSMIILTVK